MRTNRIKEKFRNGQAVVGIEIGIPNPILVNALSKVGFDFMMLDMEHTSIDRAVLPSLIIALEASETEAIVRVPWNDFVIVKQVLDSGVYNVIFPMINSAEEARQAVAATRYPPDGIRGSGPWLSSGYYAYPAEYMKRANDEVGVFVQIEHQKAVDNMEEILSVEGVDGTFCGPSDLSFSLGKFPGEAVEEVRERFERVLEVCQKHNVAFGLASGDPDNANFWLERGAKLVTLGGDMGFALDGARKALEAVAS